jgi:hypothetical protein
LRCANRVCDHKAGRACIVYVAFVEHQHAGGRAARQTQFIRRHAFRVHKSQNYASRLGAWEQVWFGLFVDFASGVAATPLVCEGAMGDNSLIIISLRASGGLIWGERRTLRQGLFVVNAIVFVIT